MSNYQIVPYEHNSEIEAIHYQDDIWLTQKEMAEIFDTTIANVSLHVRNLEKTDPNSKFKESLIKVAGKRSPYHYPLRVALYVGFNVHTAKALVFQEWATNIIRKFLLEGVAVNPQADIDDVASRVRAIRTSEQTFAKKMNAIFAMASDYDPKSEEAKLFFATVTNKLHYAIHGHTAAELIVERVNADKPQMGLVTVKGKNVTLADAKVAKNYLSEDELVNMARLAEQFLLFAELAESDGRLYTMRQWIEKLNSYIRMNEKLVLQSKGIVSGKKAEAVMRDEYKRYKQG